jgi:hypothetical protein
MNATIEVEECLHAHSAKHGPLHCARKLPSGRFLATMHDDATLPGCSSSFDADDVTVGKVAPCPDSERPTGAA